MKSIKRKGLDILKKLAKFKFALPVFSLVNVLPLNKKYSNVLLNLIEQEKGKEELKSYPYKASLNVTNLCNLRCKFCEIHYFYWKANQISGRNPLLITMFQVYTY